MQIFLYVILAILVLMLVVMAIYQIVGYILYRLILTRKGKMVKKIVKYFEDDEQFHLFDETFKRITIKSQDNLNLVGYYKDNNSDKLVILVHGYGGNHKNMAKFVKIFEKKDYDILAIDLRSHGESEGRDITMGKFESEDLQLWICKMLEIKANYKIVLFGVSMGASTVCLTIGEKLPCNVVLAIEDSGYDNADKELKFMFLQHKILSKLCYKIFYYYTARTQELDLKKIDITSKIKNAKIPVLFIHGDSDQVVPTEMVYSLSSQVPDTRRDVYIGKEAGHVGSIKENPSEYEKIVNKFLSQYNL